MGSGRYCVRALIIAIGAAGAPFPASQAAARRLLPPNLSRRSAARIRTFRLVDGSRATLDTDSRLDVAFSHGERSVRLVRGRVRLSVAPGDVPLRIEAGHGGATANDAEIDLSLAASGRVVASQRRGAAEVRADADVEQTMPLKAGSALAYGPGSRLEPVAAPAAVVQPDWTEGWAEYRSIKLGALVAEANPLRRGADRDRRHRHSRARSVGSLPYQPDRGIWPNGSPILFGLAVERRSDAIHLRRR